VILFAPVFSALWVYLAKPQPGSGRATQVRLRPAADGPRLPVHGEAAAGIVAGGMSAPAYLLILTYLLTVFGELCVSPVGLSTVTKLAPARLRRADDGRVVPRAVRSAS
jgi:proton-dependent oligopeptide transporter, POT family